MVSTLIFSLGADLSSATLDVLVQEVAAAHRTYDLALARELVPALERRVNTAQGQEVQALRQLLAEDALLAASLLRYEYEKPDTNNVQKRALGKEIDAAASMGFSALGGLPDTSEKARMTADLLMMMMRSKFKGKTHQESMEAASDRALELDPQNPKALLTKSRPKLFAEEKHGGDFEEGLAMVNRALELDPNDEGAYVLRGLAYHRHGMYDEAIADWERALEINPEAKPARERLEAVRSAHP